MLLFVEVEIGLDLDNFQQIIIQHIKMQYP